MDRPLIAIANHLTITSNNEGFAADGVPTLW